MKTIFILIISLSLFSCSAEFKAARKAKHDAPYNSWLGEHKSVLFQSWGPPTRVADDGNGGDILIFQRGYTYYPRGGVYYHYVFFFSDSQGKVYHWMKQTKPVPPSQLVFSFQ